MSAELEAAFRDVLASVERAWQTARADEEQNATRYRVDTLSASLADPREHQIGFLLTKFSSLVESDTERGAFVAIARAVCAHGLLSNESLELVLAKRK